MISVIIVNYRVKKELFACIESIASSKPKMKYEIIVVDNDENKILKSELHNKFPKIIYIPNENKGFGQGNNVGAKHAKGKYFFFLNPDTKFLNNCIDELVNFLNNHDDTAITAPLLFDKNNTAYPLQGVKILTPLRAIFALSFINKLLPDNRIYQDYYLRNWNKKNLREVDVVPGTAFVIKREIFEKLGGFDDTFFLYFEEFDLCKRVKDLGLKIFIIPSAKIFHRWGNSVRKMDGDVDKIFRQSRFYYLKKHFGLMQAFFTEAVLRFNKYIFFLIILLGIGIFLRIYNLSKYMDFIGDQGWFYLSARDALLTGQIPLVGVTSSHTWLHQGPYWTYIVAFLFWIFNFNPVVPAYFMAFLGTLTIWLIYKVSKELFSEKIGLISAIIYASSPLIIANDRFAYHTSPIPFLTLLFIFFIYKWIRGNPVFFVPALISLGILYNFELATASLFGVLFLFLFYGIIKKKIWAVKVFDWKILLISIIGFILSMAPVIIYDFRNGFTQTLIFGGWIFYKIFKFIAGFSSSSLDPGLITSFLASKYKFLISSQYDSIAFLIFLSSFIYLLFKVFTKNKEKISYLVLLFVFLFPLLSIYLNKTASDAYIPVLFPSIIAITSVFFASFIKHFDMLGKVIIFVIIFFNLNFIFRGDFFAKGLTFKDREKAVAKIITLTKDKRYNLIGKGEGSQFESFTMNYEYLLWREGYPPSKANVKNKIIISDTKKGIIIEKIIYIHL